MNFKAVNLWGVTRIIYNKTASRGGCNIYMYNKTASELPQKKIDHHYTVKENCLLPSLLCYYDLAGYDDMRLCTLRFTISFYPLIIMGYTSIGKQCN